MISTKIRFNKLDKIENNKTKLSFKDYVVIGLLLGDGSLYKNTESSNARLELSFGENYKDFALSIQNILKDFILNPMKEVKIKGKSKIYSNYRIKTRSLPFFTNYYDMFYSYDSNLSKYVKIIPSNIDELINSVSLAYLLMGDGNFDKGRKRIRVYTNNFKKEEVERLAKVISSKFGIYVGVLHDRKNQWILTIGAKQLDVLRDLVKEHFDKSMLYRIGLP